MQNLQEPKRANLSPATRQGGLEQPAVLPYLPAENTFDPVLPSASAAQNAANNSSAEHVSAKQIKESTIYTTQLSGVIPVAQGGTGVNLQNTGGQGQVLTQPATGGPIKVTQLTFQSVTGTLAPSQLPQQLSGTNLTVTGASAAGTGSNVVFGTTTGIGNGGNTGLSGPAIGSGSGPTTFTVVKWLKVYIGTSAFWIALFQ